MSARLTVSRLRQSRRRKRQKKTASGVAVKLGLVCNSTD